MIEFHDNRSYKDYEKIVTMLYCIFLILIIWIALRRWTVRHYEELFKIDLELCLLQEVFSLSESILNFYEVLNIQSIEC